MKITFTLLSLLISSFVWSQNLIPNPSFEDVNTCQKYHELCAPKGWRATLLKNFYYPEYLPNVKATRPAEGSRFIGLTLIHLRNDYRRQFAQAALVCELEAGRTYELTLYYMVTRLSVESFGVYFSDVLKVYKDNERFKNIEPQITIQTNPDLNSGVWQKATATFTAKGNEKGIIIGNFKTDDQTTIFRPSNEKKRDFEKDKGKVLKYYFDNISLKTADNQPIDECDFQENLAFIYEDSIRHIREHPKTIFEIPAKKIAPISNTDSLIAEPSNTLLVLEEDTIKANEIMVFPNINFATNSARLLPEAFPSLEKLVFVLHRFPHLSVNITGHTDNIGTASNNLLLSKRRASSVAAFLIRSGISNQRIQFEGKGETMPVTENDSELGRLINRRVEFLLK